MFSKASLLFCTPLCFCILLIATPSISFGQQTKFLQHLWEVDPPLGDIWETKQTTRTIRFDVDSLRSPYAKDRLETAQQICLEHSNPNFHQRERAIELLVERLKSGEENLQIRRAMFSAAVSVGDESHTEVLWSLAKSDSVILSLVERNLVRWKSAAALKVWRQRLSEPNAKPTELATALEGLAVVGNSDDRIKLQDFLGASHTSIANKYLAACALGALVTEGLNEFAQQVMDSDLEQRHLIASQLLKLHSGVKTETQLRQILADGSASAQLVAYRSMTERIPDLAREFAKQMTTNLDPGLRILALEQLQKFSDDESLQIQAELLNDRDPTVRGLVAKHLLEKAKQGQRGKVNEVVVSHLNSEVWTGIEQAIVVAVGLQDRSHCKTIVRLMEHPRIEVNMRAGWALMEIADESEILASMLTHAEAMTVELKNVEKRTSITHTDQIRLSYLHEAFGKNRYQPATEMLTNYIPKTGHQFGIVSRASAIWALGKLNKGINNKVLLASLYKRIMDLAPINPEDPLVRFACNLAVGEMANPESRETIEKYNEGLPSPLGYAAHWALSQIDQAAAVKPVE